jgi:F0F1-type ATP synthase membrane subunit b/b'
MIRRVGLTNRINRLTRINQLRLDSRMNLKVSSSVWEGVISSEMQSRLYNHFCYLLSLEKILNDRRFYMSKKIEDARKYAQESLARLEQAKNELKEIDAKYVSIWNDIERNKRIRMLHLKLSSKEQKDSFLDSKKILIRKKKEELLEQMRKKTSIFALNKGYSSIKKGLVSDFHRRLNDDNLVFLKPKQTK